MSDSIRSVLQQLDAATQRAVLFVEGHALPVTSLDKVLGPGVGRRKPLTKRDLLRYYARVSPWLLPHVAGRPIFVTRFPGGVAGKSFYQKHWQKVPPFVRTVRIYASSREGDGDYLLCENLPTLLWLAQYAGLEIHAWFSRIDPGPDARGRSQRFHGSEAALERSVLNYPDFIVFDLDPYEYSGKERRGGEPELNRRAFNQTGALALKLREMLEEMNLRTWVKTSGRTGLHLYLPILRELDFDAARGVAETIARHVRDQNPKDVTIEWAVEKRRGRIFFDYNQNVRGKSLAVPFSPRRHPMGTVSMPLTWEELGSVYPTDFTLRTVADRLEISGDPWAGILEAKQDLTAALGGEGLRPGSVSGSHR